MSEAKPETKPVRRPLPNPPPESQPYWQGAREHRLMIPRCNACGQAWFPPSAMCPHCLSSDTGWEAASGRGKVFSFVVVHRVYHPYFADKVPYVVAVIELDEGPRLLSGVTGIEPGKVRCNMPVEVVFEDATADVSIPKFKPSGGADGS
jgi:uncharacterized OB-fold protein